jgi:hypothetical protein
MLASIDHDATALRTGLMVPWFYTVTAAVQTDTSDESGKRRSGIANDTTDDKRLDGLAVGTAYRLDMLSHKPTSLIVVGLIATLLAFICFTLSHYRIPDYL